MAAPPPPKPPELREMMIGGACRLMYRPFELEWAKRDWVWQEIIDDQTYDCINGWDNIGATKTGVSFKGPYVKTSLAEIRYEKLNDLLTDKVFALAIAWQGKEDKRGFKPIQCQVLPKMKYLGIVNLPDNWSKSGECMSIPITFEVVK